MTTPVIVGTSANPRRMVVISFWRSRSTDSVALQPLRSIGVGSLVIGVWPQKIFDRTPQRQMTPIVRP